MIPKTIFRFFLCIYLIILVWVSLSHLWSISPLEIHPIRFRMNWNPINFTKDISYFGWAHQMVLLIVPTLLYLPAGCLLPLSFNLFKSANNILWIGLLFPFSLELFQGFIGRVADITDAICGILGMFLGYAFYLFCLRKIMHRFKSSKSA